uniref:C3HC-type domain-containing protein n=1 Tax=Zea mays TaxID=4577 RepID=A0A804QUC8_MAIZE
MAAGEGGGGDIGADSERRLQKAMDKLYHFPKPKSSSTGGSKPSSSTSAPSSGRAVGKAAAEAARRFGVVRGSRLPHQMLAMAAISPPPPCRPWDRADLMRRLGSFKAMTWFAKPKVISPVNCARRGWTNIEPDVITCEACGARLLFSTPSSWTTQQVEKAAAVFSLKLDSGHKLLCPWIDNICDESLALFPPTPPPVLVGNYYELLSSLLRLLALPRISCSSLETMKKRNPQLEQFLSEPFSSSVVLKGGLMLTEDSTIKDLDDAFQDADTYYQALKIISLCGWEPRLLPYAVDCGTEFHSDANSTSKLAQPEQSSSMKRKRSTDEPHLLEGDADDVDTSTIGANHDQPGENSEKSISNLVVSTEQKQDGSHSNAAKDTELDEASNETQPETGSPLRKSITSTYADADQHGLEPRFCSVQGTNEEPSGGVTLTEMHANNSRSTEVSTITESLVNREKEKQGLYDRMNEFDPIKQHRTFCPWTSPDYGEPLPGWRLTLSALLAGDKRSDGDLQVDIQTSLLDEEDDPLTSVRKLFMTPPPKRRRIQQSEKS